MFVSTLMADDGCKQAGPSSSISQTDRSTSTMYNKFAAISDTFSIIYRRKIPLSAARCGSGNPSLAANTKINLVVRLSVRLTFIFSNFCFPSPSAPAPAVETRKDSRRVFSCRQHCAHAIRQHSTDHFYLLLILTLFAERFAFRSPENRARFGGAARECRSESRSRPSA